MSILLDTNLLTRLAQQTHPQHGIAQNAVLQFRQQGERLCIVPQNLYEFWAVGTRPIGPNNGLGLDLAQMKQELARIVLFILLPDLPGIYAEWERLVAEFDVKGKNTHDARLVAAMTLNGIKEILTFNERDFSRYSGIRAISPEKRSGQTP